MPRVAVCLSGCGFLDGSEIHEAVLTLLALDQAGAEVVCCSLDKPQADVVDHVSQCAVPNQTRNMLAESARIARGNILPVSSIDARNIDAIIFPGGYGAAKNLCTFAEDGAKCEVEPDVETLVSHILELRKPIGAICIAPAMLARVLGNNKIEARVTIGTDPKTASAINRMGVSHCECPTTEMVSDPQHKIVSTPAYMTGKGPAEVFEGIKKLVDEVIRLI